MKRITVIAGLLAILLLSSLSSLAQTTQSREDLLKEIEARSKEFSALQQKLMEPSDEDRARYAEFLKAPDTGLIRLLPREKYDREGAPQRVLPTPGSFERKTIQSTDVGTGQVLPAGRAPQAGGEPSPRPLTNLSDLPRDESVTPTPIAMTIRGGGAYYSFTRKTHEYGYGDDIELSNGQLSVGFAGANYGMLANLGNVPLETVNLAIPEVDALASYTVAAREPEARAEYRRVQQGTEIEGLAVKQRMPAKVNSTYLLRSVNYGSSDVLVAFRVVRKDSDGSVIIAYKLLKQYPTPQLARN